MPERDAAAATPPGDGSRSTNVQAAVEQFVELHSTGRAPDPATFAARFAEDVRPAILAQCREFLAFDGLLGHQEWAPAPARETPGRAFGDFVIQEELGRGGMGVVYLAHQQSLNRRVALKVMASGLTLSRRHVERFRREAAATAQLRHPAIVSVHSLTEVDGTFALAMDFVAGRNLADMLDDLRLANGDNATTVEGSLGLAPEKGYVAECAMFVAHLASALAVAHQANVVHRDLKPRNLMLDDRRQVRLLDFGLAKSLGEGSISMSGEITGTAHYMSPEQTLAKRVEVDHRADIWSLGVILYEMLTLRRPFDGKNLQQIVYEICFKEPVSPQRRNHRVPRDLVTICQKALEKDPNKRYQTAAELEADLLRFLRWEPVHAKPAGAWTRTAKWMRRHRTETAIAGVLLVAAVGALGYQWYQGRRADDLLAHAATAREQNRYADACALVNEALVLRNDERSRLLLAMYSSESERIAALATAQAIESKTLSERNRELAIRIALEAEAMHSSLETRSAVLEALGSGSVTRTLRGDDNPRALFGIAWSADSTRAVTVGDDGSAFVWEPATARLLTTLRGHEPRSVVVGALVAGNERIVTASNDRTLRTWRLADGTPERTVPMPGMVWEMRGNRDGSRVLVVTYASDTGPYIAQVFDTATGTAVSPRVEHPLAFVALALSPSGEFAATSSGNTVRLWRVATGEAIQPASDVVRGRVRALAFAPDDSLLAIASDNTVQLARTNDGAPSGSARHSLEVTDVAFDSKGQRLLSGSRDCTARVWQLRRGADAAIDLTEVATLVGHRSSVDHVSFDASDQLVLTATGGQAGELHIFDVGVGHDVSTHAVHHYEVGPSIQAAAFAPDGRSVLALAGQGRALVWDFGTCRGVVTLRQAGWAGAALFDATGTRVVTGGTDERVRLWSAADGDLLWTSARFPKPQTRLDVDDAGERIASSSLRDGNVHVLRLADGEQLYDLPGLGGVHAIRFQPNSTRLMGAGRAPAEGDPRGGLLIVWNTNDRTRVLTLPLLKTIVAADLAADGSLVATVEEGEKVVRLWTVPGGESRGTLPPHDDAVHSVRFAPDSRSVLTASRDGTARMHDLAGNVTCTLRSKQPLKLATFSPDGAFVLTCGERTDAEALLWRVADGTELLRFQGHRGLIESGNFAPGGHAVVTTAKDGTTCIWPTDPVATARRLVPGSSPPAPTTTK
jgi:WD40 repeat protein